MNATDPRNDPNRPTFPLEPWDIHAPLLVRMWAAIREDAIIHGLKPVSDMEQVSAAKQRAYQMERWYRANVTDERQLELLHDTSTDHSKV